MSSRTLVARYVVALGNTRRVSFPRRQEAHVSFSIDILGIPVTMSLLIIVFMVSMFTCPSLACHTA